jgi:hypothetical protein
MKRLDLTVKVLTALSLTLAMTACKNEPKAETNTTADAADVKNVGKVQYSTKADGRNWKVINDDAQEQLRMTQFILENEEPETATELFTVTEMTDVNITPPEYFSQFITELQKRYSDLKVESKIINQKTNSLLGEWWIDGKSPDNTQHEWIRIIRKGNDIAVLRYSTMLNDNLEKTRKTWETILNNANFQ